jgi:hypothetical protein
MVDWLRLASKELSLDVKCICLDNSGENTEFHILVQYKSEFNIKFEFKAPGTPQKMEKLNKHFRLFLVKTDPLRKGLWASCAGIYLQLENINVK